MEYISQSINCFSKLEKQTGIESWTGNKENTTCSVCIPNSKTAYCAICMHSCPYKREGSIWLHQTHKQGTKPIMQKETQGSNCWFQEPYFCRSSNLHNVFGWFLIFLITKKKANKQFKMLAYHLKCSPK